MLMTLAARITPRPLWGRLQDAGSLMSSMVFMIRVGSAAVAYLVQILFARWMGPSEYGTYVYAWTWVIVAGGMADLGLATAAQRFIPEYRARGDIPALRGFLRTARLFPLLSGGVLGAVFAGVVFLTSPFLTSETVKPLYVASLCIPLFALAGVQDGVARSHHWVMLGLVPDYILRPIAILVLGFVALTLGAELHAATAMTIALAGMVIGVVVQRVILERRLISESLGEKRYEFARWRSVSIPIFVFFALYLALTNIDIVMLNYFRTPSEVGVYYAASKTFALVAFVSFAVSTVSANRISEFAAQGQSEKLRAYLAQAVQWTFWPSLAGIVFILAIGPYLLRLFGPDFMGGYELLFIMAVGLLVQASTGPAEAVLNMQRQEVVCAKVYAVSFAFSVLACILLIPSFGIRGAAVAISATLCLKSALLFIAVKQRLALHAFIFGGAAGAAQTHHVTAPR